MAFFFFHQRSSSGLILDPDGSDLPDLESAIAEAVVAARHLWADAILGQVELGDGCFEIGNEQGKVLAIVPFASVLPTSLRNQRDAAVRKVSNPAAEAARPSSGE